MIHTKGFPTLINKKFKSHQNLTVLKRQKCNSKSSPQSSGVSKENKDIKPYNSFYLKKILGRVLRNFLYFITRLLNI